MTRLLVTGASGLLGLNMGLQVSGRHAVTGVVNTNGLTRIPFPIVTADLAAPDAAERLVDEVQPEVMIHCAAMANVDECETQPERARLVNALLPGRLAAAAAQRGVQMVHISTDAVFDGQPRLDSGYCETDAPNPLSVYARTKLEGEQQVLAANPAAIVARVNFYGWSLTGQRSLAEFFFNNLSAGRGVKGFTDVLFCPLLVHELVDILLRMTELRLTGLYHVVSSEALSKYDFGLLLAQTFGLDGSLIQPISVAEAGLRAVRSPDLRLNTSRLAQALGAPLPGQRLQMQRFYELYQQGYPRQLRALRGEPA